MKYRSVITIFFLILISSFFIFYKFTQIPKYLAYDEIEFTKLALSLDKKPYIVYSPLATGHSTLYFYILLIFLKIFGINTFALRLPSAIFGILSIVMFYLIMKEISKNQVHNSKLIIINSLILLTSRWFLNFSRFAFEPTFLLFLELTSIYFFLKGFICQKNQENKNNKNNNINNIYLILSGVFTGLSFNSYTPGRVFFLLPLFFIVKSSFSIKKERIIINIKKALFFIIPFLLIITPLTYQLKTIKDTRIDQLFFWRNHEMSIKEKINGTWQNISSLTLMFFIKGDMNGRHNYPGKPALNLMLGVLGILGVLEILRKKSNFYDKFFFVYFIISLLPSIPIYPWENPSMLRTFTALPSIVYFIGNGLNISITIVSKILIKRKVFILYILYFIIFLSSFYELRTYFKYQSKVFESAFEIKYPLEKAIKIKKSL